MSDEKYALYRGDKINTVSLWVRKDGREYPIYANTRGQCEWYSFDPDVSENTSASALSETFKEWLAHFYRVRHGLIDTEGMFPADAYEQAEPETEPEWFETEILNHIDNSGMTPEQEALLEWAYGEVEE